MILNLAATLPQVANQFFARFELCSRRLVAIEIAHQTNAERDIVQVIAVHMTAIDLPPPAIAHLDLAVAGRCAIANHKMVSEPVPHAADMSMVVIKNGCVTLPGAAVVDDDELPAPPLH